MANHKENFERSINIKQIDPEKFLSEVTKNEGLLRYREMSMLLYEIVKQAQMCSIYDVSKKDIVKSLSFLSNDEGKLDEALDYLVVLNFINNYKGDVTITSVLVEKIHQTYGWIEIEGQRPKPGSEKDV